MDLGSPREGRTNCPLAGVSDLVYTAFALMTTFALPFVKASENLTLKGTGPRTGPLETRETKDSYISKCEKDNGR